MLLRSGSGENSLPGCRWLHLSYLLVGGRERDRHTDREGDNNEDGKRERERERDREEIPNSQQDSPESFFNFFTVHIKC